MSATHRQGDVLLVPVADIPKGARRLRSERAVLAEGEVTGHVHELVGGEVDLFRDSGGAIFAQITVPTELRHAEHLPQVIDPGVYRVVRQFEHWPAEFQMVGD